MKISLREPLRYLETVPFQWDGRKRFDLSVMRALLPLIGDPHNKVPAIHVGGTNGKGTTCAYLSAMLHAAGFRVGQTSSPHLSHVTERCLINGAPISEEEYGDLVIEIVHAAEDAGLEPSHFEIVTAVAFLAFARRDLDWMVVEVGLGGRLDATNTMDRPRASVVTGIARDHTQILGNSEEEIAREKAGIFRHGVPVFVGAVTPAAEKVLREEAARVGAPIQVFGKEFVFDTTRSRVCFDGDAIQLDCESLGLIAPHQIENASLAVRVAQAVSLSEKEICRGLSTARWPGRLERLRAPRPCDGEWIDVLLDGAHNPNGINALLNYLRKIVHPDGRWNQVVFLLSFLQHKEWKEMIGSLCAADLDTQFVFSRMEHNNSADPYELSKEVPGSQAFSNSREALNYALDRCAPETVLVGAGSLYFLGEIRPLLTPRPFRTILLPDETGMLLP